MSTKVCYPISFTPRVYNLNWLFSIQQLLDIPYHLAKGMSIRYLLCDKHNCGQGINVKNNLAISHPPSNFKSMPYAPNLHFNNKTNFNFVEESFQRFSWDISNDASKVVELFEFGIDPSVLSFIQFFRGFYQPTKISNFLPPLYSINP